VSRPELLLQLQDSLIAACSRGREVVDVGGFRAMINGDDRLEYFSYAMPVGEIGAGDVDALVAHFRSRDRKPRLEFCRELWPEVPAHLEAAGFTKEFEGPVMILPRSQWRGGAARVPARLATGADALTLRKVANQAFGMPEDEGDERQSAIQIDAGALLAALVELDGKVVGCGFAQGTTAVREVAGIVTI
jgi:hypothetical protein